MIMQFYCPYQIQKYKYNGWS